MIVIVDYGMGNLRSVFNKFKKADTSVQISSDPNVIAGADKLILPGVGHFKNGMKHLKEYNLIDVLNKKVMVEKTPILGICLGVQLFTQHSEEGDCDGLGWIDAETIKFRIPDDHKIKYKVPHVGWNSVSQKKESKIFRNISDDSMYYFVHSYHLKTNDSSIVLGTSDYAYEFVCAIEKKNIYGMQFHPEKSQDQGLQMFKNFIEI